MSRTFSIIGAGPGQSGLLTGRAQEVITKAQEAYATGRTAGALAALRKDWKLCPAADLAERAAESTSEQIAILVSGDAGFYARLDAMRKVLEPHGSVEVYPGMSSLQYLCAQIGESYDDVFWMESGKQDLLAALSYHSKVCLLLEGNHTPAAVCTQLCAAGLGRLRVVVGTRLGTGREHIVDQTAQLLRNKKFAAPAILLLFQQAPTDPNRPIFDTDLVGMDGMLRQEVRWNAANLLRVKPDETVYDMAAGNGAVGLELARKACEGRVYAFEENEDKMSLLVRNREALGGWNLCPAPGKWKDAIQSAPAPDAAFVGTGVADIHETLAALKEKNSHVRVVVAADSLERLSQTQLALTALHFKNQSVSQLLLTRGRTLGSYTMMLAGETVFLLCAGK